MDSYGNIKNIRDSDSEGTGRLPSLDDEPVEEFPQAENEELKLLEEKLQKKYKPIEYSSKVTSVIDKVNQLVNGETFLKIIGLILLYPAFKIILYILGAPDDSNSISPETFYMVDGILLTEGEYKDRNEGSSGDFGSLLISMVKGFFTWILTSIYNILIGR